MPYRMPGGNSKRVLEAPIRLCPPLAATWSETGTVLLDAGKLFVRTKQGHLAAWDESHSSELWRFEKRGGFGCIRGDALYWAAEGGFHVVEVTSGSGVGWLDWSHGLHELVVGQLWIDMAKGSDVRTLDLESGKPGWRYSLGEKRITAGLCASADRVVACFSGGLVVALDLSTGREVWREGLTTLDPEGMAWGPRAFGGDVLVPLSDDHVVALDLETGKRRWIWRGPRASSGGSFACGDRYHLSAEGGRYYELDARTGRLLAELDLQDTLPQRLGGFWPWQPLLVSETHIFVGSSGGDLAAFDRRTGRYTWSHRAKRAVKLLDIVATDGRLYYSDVSGHMYCMEETQKTLSVGEPDGTSAAAEFEILEVLQNRMITARAPYVAPGGHCTVLRCRAGEAVFFLAAHARRKRNAPVAWGDGLVWLPSTADGDSLVSRVREAFGCGRGRARMALRVRRPTPLGLAFLGQNVQESGNGQGTWTHTKWTGENGSPEFYVRWSEAEKRGMIVEKDEAYRRDVIRFFESLVVRK